MSEQIPKVSERILAPFALASQTFRVLSLLTKEHAYVSTPSNFAIIAVISTLFKSSRQSSYQASKNLAFAPSEINPAFFDATASHQTIRPKVHVSHLAIVGKVIAHTLDFAAQKYTGDSRQYVAAVLEFLRYSAPSLLRYAQIYFDTPEEKTAWLKEKFYGSKAPITDEFTNRLSALRWKLLHREKNRLQTALDLDTFKKLSKSRQADVLYVVEHAASLHLTREQKANFYDAIRRHQSGASNVGIDVSLRELISCYEALTVREKERLTLEDFRSLPLEDQIKVRDMLKEHAKSLQTFELRILSQDPMPQSAHQVIVEHFSSLPIDLQCSINDIRPEKIAQYDAVDQEILLQLARAMVSDYGTVAERVLFERLHAADSFYIAKILQKYLTAEEKVILLNALQTRFGNFQLKPEELDELFGNLEKLLDSKKSSPELDALQEELFQLQNHDKCTIDMRRIMELVGPNSTSSLSIIWEKILAKTASGTDVVMLLVHSKSFIGSLLERSGVSPSEIDAFFNSLTLKVADVPFITVESAPHSEVGKAAKAKAKDDVTLWFSAFEPTLLGQPFSHLKKIAAWSVVEDLATARAQEQASKLSLEILQEIKALWEAVCNAKLANELYERIKPWIDKSIGLFESAATGYASNYKVHESSLHRGLKLELQPQKKVKAIKDKTADSGMSILSWLNVHSQRLVLLPFILQRALPHMVRQSYSAKDASNLFWHGLGGSFKDNQIDKLRLENFAKLSAKEQQALFELTATSSVEDALRTLDQMGPKELLAKNPSYFSALNFSTRQRIMTALHGNERLSAEELVHRYNALSDYQKRAVSAMTLHEFFDLTLDEQEDILFTVTHSEAYIDLVDTDVQRIVRKYNELPKELKDSIVCDSVEAYCKLTVQDQERVRLSNAVNGQFFRSLVMPTIEEELAFQKDTGRSSPPGWEYEQYKAHCQTSNLKHILQVYEALPVEQKAILTANRLAKCSQAKREQAQDLVERHFSVTVKDIAHLASLFQRLPARQKAKLLQLTVSELDEMSAAKKRNLAVFVKRHSKLKDNEISDAKLLVTFNRLSPSQQAEWHTAATKHASQKAQIDKLLHNECEAIKQKLLIIEKKIAALSDEQYLVLGREINSLKSEYEKLRSDSEGKRSIAESLEQALIGVQTRLSDVKRGKLVSLRKEIEQDDRRSTEMRLEIESKATKQKLVTDTVHKLYELQYELHAQLNALHRVRGLAPYKKELVESPFNQKTAETVHSSTISEMCEMTKNELIQMLEKAPHLHFEYQKLLDKMVEIKKQSVAETSTQRRMNQMLVQKLEEVKLALEKHLEQHHSQQALDLHLAQEQLKALASYEKSRTNK